MDENVFHNRIFTGTFLFLAALFIYEMQMISKNEKKEKT